MDLFLLCNLFGQTPGYRITGARPDERPHATLATRAELAFAEDFGDYLRLGETGRPLDCDLLLDEGEGDLNRWIDYSSDNVSCMPRRALGATLLAIPALRAELDAAGRDLTALDAKYGTDLLRLVPQPGEQAAEPAGRRSREFAEAPLKHA